MTTADSITRRSFVVWWKELDSWAIPSGLLLLKPLPSGWKRVRIGDVVRQVDARTRVEPNKQYKMAGVKWYGQGVFHRETVHGDKISASYLTRLIPGALVYNRLFAWKASFAVVQEGFADCYVSNEFPQFIPDRTQLLPEYLYLFSIQPTTIRAVNSASTGSSAVSRNRFREGHFLAFEMPLPPLQEQIAIVDWWHQAQQKIAILGQRAESANQEGDRAILSMLGIPFRQSVSLPKMFAIKWNDLERWSVDYLARSIFVKKDLEHSKYPLILLGDVADISYGIAKSPMNRPGKFGRPYLRVANVQKGELDLREIKTIEVPDADFERFRLRRDDLLVCEGNSADLVGRPAIWKEEIPNCVHQNHILRVRINYGSTLPAFVLEYMHTQPARDYFRSRAKFTTHLASINSTDLHDLPIPKPPIDVQNQIAERLSRLRSQSARDKMLAEDLSQKLNSEIEALMSGTINVRDI